MKTIAAALLGCCAWVMVQGCGSGTSTTGGAPAAAADGGSSSGNPGDDGSSGKPGADCMGCTAQQICVTGKCQELPATCPCPLDSYCELGTNTCRPGCAAGDADCSAGRYCDAAARACKIGCRGDAECKSTNGACKNHACVAVNQCNTIPQLGMSVDVFESNVSPVPQGGAIANGTYVLTSLKLYNSSTEEVNIGTYGKVTLEMSGSAVSEVTTDALNAETRATYTLTISGTRIVDASTKPTCIFPSTGLKKLTLPLREWGFTASASTLILVEDNHTGSNLLIATFTKK